MGIGAWSQRVGISGLTWQSMKTHYGIIPTIGFTVLGMMLAGAHVIRLAAKGPEVSWTKGNPEPWNEYANKQYKYLSSGRDYSIPSGAPKYK